MSSRIEKIKQFWKQPVFLLNSRREKWGLVIFLALYIPLFLIIFQPFGVNNYDPTHTIRWEFLIAAFSFGISNAITLSIFEFAIVPYLFKRNSRLVFVIRMMFELLLLSFVTYLLYNVFGNFHDWNWLSFLGFIRDIIFSSIIPLSIIFLYFNYKRTKEDYQYLLDLPNPSLDEKALITLVSDNGKERVSIRQSSLLYLEAQDNYIEVHSFEEGNIKKVLLRVTMKTLEAKLKTFHIMRCHRSYMVNMMNVKKAKGNAHQLQLYLVNLEHSIPVSRSYMSNIKSFLDIYHK